ncbi:hypothetical protein SLS60_000335 [Paraconiothyrium brasiliense]|uniref:Serine protease n=1 Tax=Paraconiothyrium brasiliense TaxID=300254 RepID=A0ABR3S655_9PLEO
MRFSAILAILVSGVTAYRSSEVPNYRNHRIAPSASESLASLNVSQANATFEQWVSHSNHSLGTFPQFYWYSTQWWKGPGSPVILHTPGELNASSYNVFLTTNRTTGLLAQELGAAIIVLEHRYWGTSTPVTEFTTETLQYLTLDEAIQDFVHFARTATLPWDEEGTENAPNVPWVFAGGSYAGALSAWTAKLSPGTFWAHLAASAVVEITGDFWQYFLPVQQGMPANCSKDVSLVVDHVDAIGTNGTEEEQHALKDLFGLAGVTHFDDFASALTNALWLWQGNQLFKDSGFWAFCDAVENVAPNATEVPGAQGVGVEKALAGYAEYFNNTILPGFCEGFKYYEGERNVDCFDTYNASSPMFSDTSISNTYLRQWVWMTCNEPFGYWQSGAPRDRPTIVSRFSSYDWWVRQCDLYFPPVNGYTVGISSGRTYEAINAKTDGWFNTDIPRLFYGNGGNDPWREATVSAQLRPGGPYKGENRSRVEVIPKGFHSSDTYGVLSFVDPDAKRIILEEIRQVKEWVGEFPGKGVEWPM